MTVEQQRIDSEALSKASRRGVTAALILGVLTIVEFFIATEMANPLLPLIPFVFLKGWIILDSFMHVRALWRDDH